MINFYAFYDNSLKLCNPPFMCQDDNSAIKITRNMLVSSSDDVLSKVLPCTELVFVGSFDEVEVQFINVSDKRKICNLSDIPLPDGVINNGGDL